jgi:hemoglobin
MAPAEAFDDWLAVFESAANDELASKDAREAIRIAHHMANSFKAGMFPFTDAEGRPSRTPQA